MYGACLEDSLVAYSLAHVWTLEFGLWKFGSLGYAMARSWLVECTLESWIKEDRGSGNHMIWIGGMCYLYIYIVLQSRRAPLLPFFILLNL
jgi:hypothetical protein